MVPQYNIPNEVIDKFMERGKLKLAFLVGDTNDAGNVITVSHIVIPSQHEYQPDSKFGK